MGRVRGHDRAMPRLSTAALLDQLGQTCARLLYKPGTAFLAQQRPIEPVVLGDLLGLQGSAGLSVQFQLWDLHDAEFRTASLENGRSNDHA